MDTTGIYILIIIGFATLVRSTFGFGGSLLSVPLLLLFVPITTAVPISVLTSTSIAALVSLQDRKNIEFQSVKWLVLFAGLGIPFGIGILQFASPTVLKFILGVLIISYCIFSFSGYQLPEMSKNNKKGLFFFGFLSGVTGGACGLNGPPLVIYGNLRRWNAIAFRASLQAYFLPISTITMIGYYLQGLWTPEITTYYLWSFPIVIPLMYLGRYINRTLKQETFLKYIYLGLTAVGSLLIYQSQVLY
ncbi:MAG: permease [Bacteroidetes bacterium MedPE-SWsnd-G2]|nr:MAG: permease [Bacteroidetes bacterium MedPE-SWsnd-G2]